MVTLGTPFLYFDKDIKVRKHNIMIIEHINHIYGTINGSKLFSVQQHGTITPFWRTVKECFLKSAILILGEVLQMNNVIAFMSFLVDP